MAPKLTLVTAPSPILCQSSHHAELKRWQPQLFNVVPDNNFDDSGVRADIGQEFGHCPTREAAEWVAHEIAQQREAELVVHLPDEKNEPNPFCKKLGRQIVPAMIRGIERRPVTPSRRRHARGSMPGIEAGA